MDKLTKLSLKAALSVVLAVTCVTTGIVTVLAGSLPERDESRAISNTDISFEIKQEQPTEYNYTLPTDPTEEETTISEETTQETEITDNSGEEAETEETTEATDTETETETTTEATTEATETETETVKETVVLQTLSPLNISEADRQNLYKQQWNAGYLYAIDYPDYNYVPAHVTLTKEDRDICERLVMGEFGSGGFIGAALIAQCIRDAMVFDGYKSVEDVRVQCKYTGRTDIAPTAEVKSAVAYVFDNDKPAVQHRLFYMYNPNLCTSAWHESMAYVLTYQDVRFFDRPW